MSMTVRYAGDFLSRKGAHWRCEILQESDVVLPVGELTFPADEPLLIEYEETSLEVPICPSKATLTIESPGDRTYADLYTIKPGQIRLDVYRYVKSGNTEQKNLYWSGCLDPEFYEEPYDRGANYDVQLTFSDFGILKRIPYDLSGQNSLLWILSSALQRSNIASQGIGQNYISSVVNNTTSILGQIQVASENFFDEDGVAFDYYKVLEGILQPLALRMVQVYGGVEVYDLNGVRNKTTRRKIEWDGVGQQMSVGSVYNNIKITFSPYSSAELLSGELTYEDVFGPEWTNLTDTGYTYTKYNGGTPPAGMTVPECYSFYIDYDESHRQNNQWDYNLISFTIFLASAYANPPKCKGLVAIGNSNRYFKIFPNLGGQETEGVMSGFSCGHLGWDRQTPTQKGMSPLVHNQSLCMRTNKAYLPALSASDAANNYIRIRQEILVDPRYNPFEEASKGNEQGNYDTFKSYASHAFVPVAITLYNQNGTALYHYTNKTLTQKGHPDDSVRNTLGSWASGAASFGDAWLAYYNADDLLMDTGLGGWSPNHHNFGKPWTTGKKEKKRVWHYEDSGGTTRDFYQFDSMKKIPDGQYIPYPPTGGYLEIVVYNGVYILDDTERFTTDYANTLYADKYRKLRWVLYKAPEVSVVKRTLTFDKAEVDDIEYSGVINVNAKEDLEIDTICGTTPDVCPTAKGSYLKTSDGLQLKQITRAGKTDCPEHLLIGTLYSQFSDRRTSLSGEVAMDVGLLATYYDEAQEEGVIFLKVGEEQNPIEDMTEATFLEIRPDEYTGV